MSGFAGPGTVAVISAADGGISPDGWRIGRRSECIVAPRQPPADLSADGASGLCGHRRNRTV